MAPPPVLEAPARQTRFRVICAKGRGVRPQSAEARPARVAVGGPAGASRQWRQRRRRPGLCAGVAAVAPTPAPA